MKIETFTIVAGTEACNASCPYCISKMTPKQGVGLRPSVNWLNFDKACRLAQMNNVTTVLVTGKGEPLLYPDQITAYLEKIRKYEFPLIEIQTNALVIGTKYREYEAYLKKWRELGLNTIAISVVSYKREKNKEIYTPKGDYMDLKEVVDKLHDLGYSIRFSCMMLKGFIDSIEEVKELIKKANEWKIEQLTIRSIRVPKESENKEVYTWTKKRVIDPKIMEKLHNFLEKNANKIMTLGYGAIVYDFNGQNVCLSDCLTIKPNTEDLRQLIFFPDSHLRYDWQYKGAIIL
jgi:molybdenum cofactor biosynthesis enzyme MoaA